MRLKICFASLAVLLLAAPTSCIAQARGSASKVTLHFENPISNSNYPELLYWFVTPETLVPRRYASDVHHIAQDTKFDFPFLTARNGVSFLDSSAGHDVVAGIVNQAHADGLRVGAIPRAGWWRSSQKFDSSPTRTRRVIADGEGQLDDREAGTWMPPSLSAPKKPVKTALLRVYAFRKTAPGEYEAATLADVTDRVKSQSPNPGTLTVSARSRSPQFAGYTAFVLATNWYDAIDLFSPAFTTWSSAMPSTSTATFPLDGVAHDEFGYIRIPMTPTDSMAWSLLRQRIAPQASRSQRECRCPQALLRYALCVPPAITRVRIRAIDRVLGLLSSRPAPRRKRILQLLAPRLRRQNVRWNSRHFPQPSRQRRAMGHRHQLVEHPTPVRHER